MQISCSGIEKITHIFKDEPAIHVQADADNHTPKKRKSQAVLDDYQLGIGDLLLISVWKDESLTRQVSILPDGTISFPLIGQINAEGRTLTQLKTALTKRLIEYIPEVVLSVQVLQLNSQVVYVVGKVNRPGRFQLVDRINVIQALAMAGGLNTFAKSGDIKIFRDAPKGTRIIPFNYDDVSNGDQLAQNIMLKRGDVIVVP